MRDVRRQDIVPWVDALLTDRIEAAEDAVEELGDVPATLTGTSAKVERKHLLGQDNKSKRGRRKSCTALALKTHRRSVINAGIRARTYVWETCLPTTFSRSSFAKTLSSYRTGYHGRESRKREGDRQQVKKLRLVMGKKIKLKKEV